MLVWWGRGLKAPPHINRRIGTFMSTETLALVGPYTNLGVDAVRDVIL